MRSIYLEMVLKRALRTHSMQKNAKITQKLRSISVAVNTHKMFALNTYKYNRKQKY